MEENIYSIPLKVKKVPRKERTGRAVREIKKFMRKQTDKEIKVDQDLNEKIWKRGAQKPPSSVEVRLVDEEDRVLIQPLEKEVSGEEYTCEECGKTFSTEKGLKVHRQRSHEKEEEKEEVEEEKFRCEKCGKEFDTKRGLSIHQSQMHKEEEKDYEKVLSGTIPEAKKEIEKMEEPDWEDLLEVEKENKDRKGMKEYLEKKLEK